MPPDVGRKGSRTGISETSRKAPPRSPYHPSLSRIGPTKTTRPPPLSPLPTSARPPPGTPTCAFLPPPLHLLLRVLSARVLTGCKLLKEALAARSLNEHVPHGRVQLAAASHFGKQPHCICYMQASGTGPLTGEEPLIGRALMNSRRSSQMSVRKK